MNKKELLNKLIPYCIIGVFFLFSLGLAAFLSMEKLHIQEIDLSSLPISYNQCDITSIIQENDALLIEGIYFSQDQYLNSVNLSCIILNSDNNSRLGYLIPTEFFEVCDEQTIDLRQRNMAGFRARIDLDSWKYDNGTFDILLLNRCNEYHELICTENQIEIGVSH